jgi:outer membrane protein W
LKRENVKYFFLLLAFAIIRPLLGVTVAGSSFFTESLEETTVSGLGGGRFWNASTSSSGFLDNILKQIR